jgi:DNA-binding protein H-NS
MHTTLRRKIINVATEGLIRRKMKMNTRIGIGEEAKRKGERVRESRREKRKPQKSKIKNQKSKIKYKQKSHK